MYMWAYFTTLSVSIAGLVLLDWRYRLAFFYDARRATATVGSAMVFFIIWDLLGIQAGIFFSGGSPWALPYMIVPEFPVEEILFLFLLCYVTLLLYRGVCRGRDHIYHPQ